jgi:hypothetical protein
MSRDDIVQAASGGPDFTPKDWPAPERPYPPHVETMTPEERSVHDALLPIGDFGVVARHVTKALIADGWTFAAAPVTDAGLIGRSIAEAVRRVSNREEFRFVNVDWTALGAAMVAEWPALSRQAEKETA